MITELWQVTTADGLTLDGLWQMPSHPKAAAIVLHGTGSNFYSAAVGNALAPMLLERSLAVLRVNTRGHDLVATQGGRRRGAAYEVVADCCQDVQAWCERVRSAVPRIVLVGHSLGAVKAVYSQVHARQEGVQGIVAISPPRLSYSWFHEHAPLFRETFAQAQERIAQARGSELMEVTFPLPFLTTAEGYVEKYGPEERYHLLPLLPRLEMPNLVVLGSREMEGNPAFSGLDQAIRAHAPATEVEVIAGADHVYHGCRRALGDTVLAWLSRRWSLHPDV
jgi:pimeloyl-ACP methyl ester carboxylesterase